METASRIPLAGERRRRVIAVVVALVLVAVYFYEYPLYALLYLYDQYHGLGGLESAPVFQTRDGAFLAICVAGLLSVVWRSRHYLRSDGTGSFLVFRGGVASESVTKTDLTRLEIKHEYRRRTRSLDTGFTSSVKIFSSSRPDILFYDAFPSRYLWRERRVARVLERQLGGVAWLDDDGLLSKPASAAISAGVFGPPAAPPRESTKPPRIDKAYGARTFFILVFCGFAAAFGYQGYGIAAGAFGVLAGIMALDMILAMCGIGQRATKK